MGLSMQNIQSVAAHSPYEYEHDSPARDDEPKALRYFHAKSFWEAAGCARAQLRSAEICPRCSRALARVHDRIGSTLFRDDDPRALICAFDPEDRNSCTLQVLAACIVLNGRDRIVPGTHRS